MANKTKIQGIASPGSASSADKRLLNRRSFMGRALVGAGALGFGSMLAGLPSPARSQSKGPLKEVTVASSPVIDGVPVFAAVEHGILEQHGIKAKLRFYPTGVEITNSLASGEAQFGGIGTFLGMIVISKGAPVSIISLMHADATKNHYNSNVGIVARGETGILEGRVATLKGKRIGVPLGISPAAYLEINLSQNGMKPADAQLINMNPFDALSALQQGSVDAVVLSEPQVSQALSQVKGSFVVAEGGNERWYDAGIIIAPSGYARENADLVKEYLAAIAESQQWVRKNRADAAVLAGHWINGLDVAVAERALQHVNLDMRVSKNLLRGLESWTGPWMKEQGLIPASFNVDSAVVTDYMLAVQNKYPQYFDDLPEIPADMRLAT